MSLVLRQYHMLITHIYYFNIEQWVGTPKVVGSISAGGLDFS